MASKSPTDAAGAAIRATLDAWGELLAPVAAAGRGALDADDPRFSGPEWRHPVFDLVRQGYAAMSRAMMDLVEQAPGLAPDDRARAGFAMRAMLDALSPANSPLTNPLALNRAIDTGGASLRKGFEHLLADLSRGQLTHTAPDAFRVGENIAVTPGKVIHETPLYQLIQYTPTTETVLRTPLVIFPAWINRFYILDLNPRKSFVRWAVEQGITVFMVSWRSADAGMASLEWDDYIAAQIEAVELACERLDVPAAHTIGYCVAGTTLAATLAVLARRGEADRIASATFLNAQVDFAEAGDLKNFVGDPTIDSLSALASDGTVDGRYLAAAFNLLRGNDLIWSTVARHYLLGEDYPAFDLLHWNGDTTNLPLGWHRNYLRDLYRDNRLVVPDSLFALDTAIDLGRIVTPCYIQAGRDDHIAPAASVWKLTRHLAGQWTFLLAGSGHIAGVVNPPEAGKYQYWTNDAPAETLADFIAGATEHPGSWWPHWAAWLRARDPVEVPAAGRRRPGEGSDAVIEDAPGRYVRVR